MNVVRKSQLKIVERLGSGRFGEAHLCYFIGNQSSALVLVKSLETSCSFEKRSVGQILNFSFPRQSIVLLIIKKAEKLRSREFKLVGVKDSGKRMW